MPITNDPNRRDHYQIEMDVPKIGLTGNHKSADRIWLEGMPVDPHRAWIYDLRPDDDVDVICKRLSSTIATIRYAVSGGPKPKFCVRKIKRGAVFVPAVWRVS